MSGELSKFINDQLSVWPLASANFRSLKTAETKLLTIGGVECRAQHNPERIASSTAETTPEAISERACFLCEKTRPKEQFHIGFEGRKGRRYNVQVNPYPIFPNHFVLARDVHTPQSIWHNFVDMMDFARKYPDYVVFYNGPESGASAPDHMHFQACPKGQMPLQEAVDKFLDAAGGPLTTGQDAKLYRFPGFCRGVYALKADTPKSLAKLFYRLVDCAPQRADEPLLNLFTYCYGSEYRCIVTLRRAFRSHHYFSNDGDHLTMSFGAADMAGVFICPVRDDFDKLTPALVEQVLDEIALSDDDCDMVEWRLTRTQPLIEVPMMRADVLRFEIISDGAGPQELSVREGRIDYGGALYDELYFDSITRSTVFAEPSFILYGESELRFAGSLKIVCEDGKLVAVNEIGVENYLLSIVSSIVGDSTDEDSIRELVNKTRAEVCSGTLPARKYVGLTFEINRTVRKVIDRTWGTIANT